jgi:hypothetical protein
VLKTWKLCLLLLVFITSSGTVFPIENQPSSREYALKAVFLFQCTHFIEWPSESFRDSESPFVIGILGQDPFSRNLEEAVRGESVEGRSIVIEHYSTVDQIKNCQILFISSTEENRVGDTLSSLRSRSILTVSDLNDFTAQGGMVQLDVVRNKLQVKINLNVTKSAGLTISSKLLRLAEIVHGGKGAE